jgi:cell division protein FtsB
MSFINKKPNQRPSQTSGQRPKLKLADVQESRVIKIVAGLVIMALLWIIFSPGSGIVTLMSKRSELKKLQQDTARIEQQIKVLQKEIDLLHNDSRYLEDVARKNFGLLKKNERIFDFSKPQSGEENK